MDQPTQPESAPESNPATKAGPDSSPLSSQVTKLQDLPTASSQTASPGLPDKRRSLSQINRRARWLGAGASLVLGAAVLIGIGFYLSSGSKPASPVTQKALSDTDLQKLSQSSIGYDGANQSLTFHSPAAFDQDLKVSGAANIKDLTVTGTFTNAAATVEKALQVDGDTILQGQVTAKGLLRVDGNLFVGGTSTFTGNANFNGGAAFAGALSADSITVKSAQIGGLSFGHVVTTGATPSGSIGIGAGGGSFQISGNDTSGTVVINIGGGAHTGDIVNVAFRTPFSSTPHISLTPVGASSAGTAYYVTRSTTAFTVGMVNPVPGASYIFDYLVTQ